MNSVTRSRQTASFSNEPPIVLPVGDTFITLEGNRRLAALSILLGLPVAKAAGLSFDLVEKLSPEKREKLEVIPCFVIDERDEF